MSLELDKCGFVETCSNCNFTFYSFRRRKIIFQFEPFRGFIIRYFMCFEPSPRHSHKNIVSTWTMFSFLHSNHWNVMAHFKKIACSISLHLILFCITQKHCNTFTKHLNLRFPSQFKVSIFEPLNWDKVKAPYLSFWWQYWFDCFRTVMLFS